MPDFRDYDIEWTTQSTDSSQSMPLGGHDCGFNVWVQDGQLCLYLAQSGAFDENNTMLKLGRIRLWCDDPSVFAQGFCQRLHVQTGDIRISAGAPGDRVRIHLWADVHRGRLHIEVEQDAGHAFTLAYDTWRHREREVTVPERHQCRHYDSFKAPYPGTVVTYPDVVEAQQGALTFYHQNRADRLVYHVAIAHQGLGDIGDAYPNWLAGRIMGGRILCPGMEYAGMQPGTFAGTDQQSYLYTLPRGPKFSIMVPLVTRQCEDLDEWRQQVHACADAPIDPAAVQAWWRAYYDRSYIAIDAHNAGSQPWRIGRNYQLFRYMLGCNYYGQWPTKFNGGLFTFDVEHTPDFRKWSGGDFTIQNQRLVYWPMLKCGDYRAMRPQFDFFLNILEAAKAHTRHFFGHGGARFTEQISNFGMSCTGEYGWHRSPDLPATEDDSPWIRLHYSSGIEIAYMMLLHAGATADQAPQARAFAKEVVQFFVQHYEKDAQGTLRIFPSTALETYKGPDPWSDDIRKNGCTNPMDVVAGLHALVGKLLDTEQDAGERRKLEDIQRSLPALPRGEREGMPIFLPAQEYAPKPFNCELPQLYRIFPFSMEGLSDEDIEIGQNTYDTPFPEEMQYSLISWHQNGIFAARLGRADEAYRVLCAKLDDGPYRFPAFWGPGHDWMPDHNWGGSGMIGLQEMLMQQHAGEIKLLPAWPAHIPVSFRLFDLQGHAHTHTHGG